MRMIYNVIKQMLAVIPADQKQEPKIRQMIDVLENVANSTLYKAPEQMPEYFRYVSNVLTDCLGDPTLPDTPAWKQQIADIFADRTDK